jgi:hypothetical protein
VGAVARIVSVAEEADEELTDEEPLESDPS